MISSFFTSLIVYSALVAQPATLSVNLSAAVAPEAVDSKVETPNLPPVLPTSLRIFKLKDGISFNNGNSFNPKVDVLYSTEFFAGSRKPSWSGQIPSDPTRTFISLSKLDESAKDVFGTSAIFFHDVLQSLRGCKQSGNVLNCDFILSAIQLYDAQPNGVKSVPANVTKVRLKVFRQGTILKREIKQLLSENETADSFLKKYSRNSKGEPLTEAQAQSGAITGYFFYAGYVFDQSVKAEEAGSPSEQKFERQFPLSSVSSRIPLLTREKSRLAEKNSPEYFIERETTIKENGSEQIQRDQSLIDLEVGSYKEAAVLNFQAK